MKTLLTAIALSLSLCLPAQADCGKCGADKPADKSCEKGCECCDKSPDCKKDEDCKKDKDCKKEESCSKEKSHCDKAPASGGEKPAASH